MDSGPFSSGVTALVCGADEALQAALRERLAGTDFTLECCAEVALPAHLKTRRPAVVVLSSRSSSLLGSLVRAEVPVIVLLREPSIAGPLRWLQLGAFDVRAEDELTVQALEDALTSRSSLLERTLAWARRERLAGELRVLPGTPLEGVALFSGGMLQQATFCGLESLSALEEMLAMDDAPVSFCPTQDLRSPRRYAARVLLVEDDEALRRLLARRIERAGYHVFEASDGLEGFSIAQRERLDVVVSDLEMPHLDGWGLLRALRDDPDSHEVPVVFLSAHDDSIDTLKAAHAGARAYLKKTGHAREMLAALSLLTEARQRAWTALSARVETSVELPALGAAWLLETVAELDLCGRLELEDDLGRYEVTLAEGHLLSASAQVGSLRVEDAMALEAVVTSRGRGRFVFLDLRAGDDVPWLYDALAQVKQKLSLAAALRTEHVVSAPQLLQINDDLASLYGRGATPRELRVLDGLRLRPASIEELSRLARTPPHDVSRLVGEFLRRGVVTEARK